ncbi:putative 18S rRNA (guanine-N(7))-methyltransferase, partial [Eschrichtius robustus]|nr:putative 18S rRNA (guanine-N(7))-methyltransferase [Eschrichtius robustus]
MGQGIPFKPGSFDGCISISAVQWLCNANKKSDIPAKRLYCFFSSLYSVLVHGARAVLQLYPENSEQLELITTQATKAGFTGGVVVDYPNSARAKKFYLCLFSGPSTFIPMAQSEENEEEEARESTFTVESRFCSKVPIACSQGVVPSPASPPSILGSLLSSHRCLQTTCPNCKLSLYPTARQLLSPKALSLPAFAL